MTFINYHQLPQKKSINQPCPAINPTAIIVASFMLFEYFKTVLAIVHAASVYGSSMNLVWLPD